MSDSSPATIPPDKEKISKVVYRREHVRIAPIITTYFKTDHLTDFSGFTGSKSAFFQLQLTTVQLEV